MTPETKQSLVSILEGTKDKLAWLIQDSKKGPERGDLQDFAWTLRVLIRSAKAIEEEEEDKLTD